ncbi:hypothetical protein GCM10023213_08850 [Prosthecobacter algae]|uniref:Beta-barrel porin-2, OmpL-like. bbp2 n=1 Tax=Prosthecobacter algae TaxID=1144682 RepID=A0ABP9NX96_9BACT
MHPPVASSLSLVLAGSLLVSGAAWAQTSAQFEAQQQQKYEYSTFSAMSAPVVLPMDGKADWLTGLDVSLAGKIFPHIHMDTAFGTASTEQEELRTGHHDPEERDAVTFQNIEFSLSGRLDEYNEFFITYAAAVTGGRIDPIFEEVFWKFKNLPGGFEVRGGRVYNRFGIQNTYHPHGFDWIDQYLVNTRILGEDSMTTIGAEITWLAPVPWTSQFDVALGVAPKGEDDHGHEHEDEGEARYATEEAFFGEDEFMLVANWTNVYNYNDFHQFRGGISGAWADNVSGYRTSIYGVHAEYQWRENGFDPGGRYFRVRSEAMFNRFKVEDELVEGRNPETQQDFGAYLSLLYGLPNNLELGLRGEYVAGNADTAQDSRFRVSPGVTWYANDARTLRFRLQYNYDNSNERGTDHAVWAQVSFAWGGPEVR